MQFYFKSLFEFIKTELNKTAKTKTRVFDMF